MKNETEIVLRGEKSAGIINALSELLNISFQEAADLYYRSDIEPLIEDKVSDLHCRSDKYLASLIIEELSDKP